MIGLMVGALVVFNLGFVAGAAFRTLSAQREVGTLRGVIAKQQAAVARMAKDNALLDHWCGRFRDLYIGTVAQIDPSLASELRAKWAQVQAPTAVARLLDRARHG